MIVTEKIRICENKNRAWKRPAFLWAQEDVEMGFLRKIKKVLNVLQYTLLFLKNSCILKSG